MLAGILVVLLLLPHVLSRLDMNADMNRTQQRQAIAALETHRGTKVITYVTGDRPSGGNPSLSLQLNIEPTVVPEMHAGLRAIGRQPKIDLFLYTRGGGIDVVWPVVSLLREYCDELSILIPFRAHSAGTLFALGADRIVMCEAAELTSVDPTTGNVFNDVDELADKMRKGISVEDVAAYVEYARDKEGLRLNKGPERLEILRMLTDRVHPLALGHVQRVHTQIRFLAKKLLAGRRVADKPDADRVVALLTEKLYSHTHAVTRRDAREMLADMVSLAGGDEGELIWALFEGYASALHLREPHNILADLAAANNRPVRAVHQRGFVETTETSSVYESDVQLALNNGKLAADTFFEGWRENNRNV